MTTPIGAHLRLVFQVFPDFPGREVPHLDKPVGRTGYQVLAVGGKLGALRVRLAGKLDCLVQHGRVFLVLQVSHRSPSSVETGKTGFKNWFKTTCCHTSYVSLTETFRENIT